MIMNGFIATGSAEDWQTLLLEQHHRTNNEFGSAIELVAMAAVRSDSAEVKATLGDIVQLLQDYAEVHRALATPDRDVLIDAAEYLQRLGFALSRSRLNRMQIRVVIAADPLPLKSDRCRRLGLMVHELITNAARHACFGGRDGQIRVELRRAGPSAKCIVSDNGSSVAGLKPGRGLKIVNDLVKALTGRLQHRLGVEGTSAALVFPLTDHELQASQAIAARRERTARRLEAIPSLRKSNRRRPTPTGVSSQVWT